MCGRSEPGRPVGPAGGGTHAQPAPGRGPSVCVPQQRQREWNVALRGLLHMDRSKSASYAQIGFAPLLSCPSLYIIDGELVQKVYITFHLS